MLEPVDIEARNFQEYRNVIDDDLFEDIIRLSGLLQKKRILYINSNQNRGGVYEHLSSVVPLLQNLGIHAHWKAITEVPADFYEVTKAIYNSIQGIKHEFKPQEWEIYENFNKLIAKEISGDNWDFVLVQDHQMLASLAQIKEKGLTKWIWQSHSETYNPQKKFITQLKKYLFPYDGVILYLPEYVFPNFHHKKIVFSSIAIDPLSQKNLQISTAKAKQTIKGFGINPDRPLITQISRIDSWKDFPGVVQAWILAKRQIPSLQLALVGVVSANNVHAKAIIEKVISIADGHEGLHLLVNKVERNNIKAFQTASNVIIQKSLREGFGLTVSEALWSGTPVIGGNVGGIKVQIVDGKSGFLVDNIEDCAARIIELIKNPKKARKMGKFGHEHIRRHFLLPRLIRDELQLMTDLIR